MNRIPHLVATGMTAFLLLQGSLASAGDWSILSVNGAEAIGEPRISLEADGSIWGNTGCNNFRGTGRFENAALVVSGPFAMTKMACPGDGLAEQEDAILRLLEGTTSFVHDPFSGAFALVRGEERLELAEEAPSVFDAEFVNVHGLSGPLNIRNAPGTDAPVVARVLPGTLLRNDGCQTGQGHDWCNVAFLDASGTAGWAAAEFLQAAPAAVRAKQGLFDNIGALSCRSSAQADTALCDYGIARDGNHSAVLVVYKTDGSERVVHFAEGELAYVEISEVEAGNTPHGAISAGTISVTFVGEYYEVPQNVVLGQVE